MGKIGSKDSVERQLYETPDDLSIPDFLRRPFIPAAPTVPPGAESKSRLPISVRCNLA
jgi:hypothetical protein